MNPMLVLQRLLKVAIYFSLSLLALVISLFFSNKTGHHISIGRDLVPTAHADAAPGGGGGEGGEGSGGSGGGEGEGSEGGGTSSSSEGEGEGK